MLYNNIYLWSNFLSEETQWQQSIGLDSSAEHSKDYTEMKCTLGSQKFLTYFDSSTSPTKKNIVYLNSNDTLD